MSEPVLARTLVAQLADKAAGEYATTGVRPVNPFPFNSDAAAAWKAAFERQLLWHTAPEAEGSA